MNETNLEPSDLYFMWPDVGYFPGCNDDVIVGRRFETALSWIVIPAVSVIGLAGNGINVVILVRGGLSKSANWLILALAVSDMLFLLGCSNITIYLYGNGETFGFRDLESKSWVQYYFFLVQLFMEMGGKIAGLLMPGVITLDRLVAVLLPLWYRRAVTVVKARVAILAVSLFSVTAYVFFILKYTLVFVDGPVTSCARHLQGQPHNNDSGTKTGVIAKSEFYIQHSEAYQRIVKIVICLYGPLPLILTCVGCVVIGYEIRKQISYRKLLFVSKSLSNNIHIPKSENSTASIDKNNKRSNDFFTHSANIQSIVGRIQIANSIPEIFTMSPAGNSNIDTKIVHPDCQGNVKSLRKPQARTRKTTRTLLSVCSVYCVASVINFLVLMIFDGQHVSTDVSIFLEMSRKLVLVLNSACNFLFYVGLNKNFREGYRKLFRLCTFKRSLS